MFEKAFEEMKNPETSKTHEEETGHREWEYNIKAKNKYCHACGVTRPMTEQEILEHTAPIDTKPKA